jgi:tetratricopeptide (TPR) repeat protein
MKLLIPLFFLALLGIDPGNIGKINSAKSTAKKAFVAGDYKTALAKYKYLTDSLGVKEDEVLMNLAHSYFNLSDTTNALTSYQKLLTSQNKTLRSNAYQQLGVIHNRQNKLEEALANFKEALKTDPTNEDARYNYEMVKKKLEEKKKQEQQNKQNQDKKDEQNKDQEKKEDQKKDDKQNPDKGKQDQEKKEQQKKEQEQKDKADKEKEKKEQEAKENKDKEQKDQKEKKDNFNPEKLKEMKVSEEKAKMILEAMKNQEVQYLQQNKRKATKPKDKGKPDW